MSECNQTQAEVLTAFASEFDGRLGDYLAPAEGVPPRLLEAVRHAALGPGKRVRPFLVVESCRLAGGPTDDAWPAAAAVECIHAFSLVHDDLPCMDDDATRRGRPTCHVAFDEATAVLAGDALVVVAFGILAEHVSDAALATRMVSELARATGWAGMIGGQSDDLEGERAAASVALTRSIHDRKTAALFEAATVLGALAGRAEAATLDRLRRFGRGLGRAFQIADDLLDLAEAPPSQARGADMAGRKQTYPRSVGTEQARRAATAAADEAVELLEPFGPAADNLRRLARFVVERSF